MAILNGLPHTQPVHGLPALSPGRAEELEEDERPRRRRRLEEAQAGMDEDEQLVRPLGRVPACRMHARLEPRHVPHGLPG